MANMSIGIDAEVMKSSSLYLRCRWSLRDRVRGSTTLKN